MHKIILFNVLQLCKRRTLPDQSLMFDSASSRLKWFMLPSEALEIMNSHHMNTKPISIRSPQPFHVKEYSSDEDRQYMTAFYSSSVPYQLTQSSWGEGDISPAKSILKSDESFHTNNNCNELYYSSNDNDSDPEILIAEGATVTGPSICFTATSTPDTPSRIAHSVSESSVVSDGLGNVQGSPCPPPVMNGALPGSPVVPVLNESGMCTTNQYMYTRTESTTSLSHDTSSQEALSRHNSVDQQQYPVCPQQVQNYQQPVNNYMISTNVQQSTSLPMNNGLNGYMEPSNMAYSYPMNQYSNPPNTPAAVFNNQYVQPQQQQQQQPVSVQQVNPNWQQQQSFETTNFPFSPATTPCQTYPVNPDLSFQNTCNDMPWGHMGSPVMTPSPVPCFTNPVTPTMFEQMHTQPVMNQVVPSMTHATEQPMMVATVNVNNNTIPRSSSNLPSPTTASSLTSIENDLVTIAMRRVTHDIANELKSEIREVISQVEQGIDPDGARERASSFSAMKDRKALEGRSRTLSGHVLRFKRSHTMDDTNNNNKENRTHGRSNSSDDSSLIEEKLAASMNKTLTSEKKCKAGCHFSKQDRKHAKAINGVDEGQQPVKWHSPPKNIIRPTLAVCTQTFLPKNIYAKLLEVPVINVLLICYRH